MRSSFPQVSRLQPCQRNHFHAQVNELFMTFGKGRNEFEVDNR
jgi:hypothetical protein